MTSTKNIAIILASAAVMLPQLASASQLSFFETQFDTDWTTAGYGGMRGVGTGDVSLSGVSGTISQAYLYWHGPTNSTDPAANASVNFAGTDITGSNIGFSDDNFWGFDNSQAYRADVTSLVTGNGNYSLSNFNKTGVEINGVSLMVFFDDGDSTNNRDVVLFDGNDANFTNVFDPLGWDISLPGINYSSGNAFLNMGVSDGQDFGTSDDGNLTVNGTIIASGGLFQGDSVPGGTGGPSNGLLWDLKDFDITSLLTPGLNNLNVTMGSVNDALSAIHVAIDLPAGAAPQQPPTNTVPEPTTLALAGIGMLGMGAIRRRRKQ